LVLCRCKPNVVGCTDPEAVNFDPKANKRGNPDPCIYYGQVTFWKKDTMEMTVFIAGRQAAIDTTLQEFPQCGTKGCPTFKLPPDSYDYEVKMGGIEFFGKVTIEQNQCAIRRVK
jgi:hypothetical protein